MLRFLLTAVVAVSCFSMYGQAAPAVTPRSAQIGIGFTAGRPDYFNNTIEGVSIYSSYDVGHSGVIAEGHYVNLRTPHDLGESTVLIGARFGLDAGRFHPYAKLLTGVGFLQKAQGFYFPANVTSRYEVFAAGAGVDLHVARHINVRMIDFEYQAWPGFQPDGLTPWLATAGAAYKF